METRILHILCITGLLFLMSCSGKSVPEDSNTTIDSSPGYVVLSPDQISHAGITTTIMEKYFMADIIECNGSIEADPNHKAMISPPLKGYLKKITVHIGEFVKKGNVLAELEHPGYIDLQQEFLMVKSQYDYYKDDFKRQGELSLENAASIKKMQQAQNEFRKIEAQFYSLKKHLAFIGINADSLKVENLRSEIKLVAPISGYITQIEGNIGKLCPEEEAIFQIVGTYGALLHLKVYEKDAINVKIGQEINFSIISNAETTFIAEVKAAARAIDDSKTVSIHARIKGSSDYLMPGMFVKASILVNSDSVYALNEESIISKNGKEYILIKTDSTAFKPLAIETGRKTNRMTEILNVDAQMKDSEIVSSGAYYLFSEYSEEE